MQANESFGPTRSSFPGALVLALRLVVLPPGFEIKTPPSIKDA